MPFKNNLKKKEYQANYRLKCIAKNSNYEHDLYLKKKSDPLFLTKIREKSKKYYYNTKKINPEQLKLKSKRQENKRRNNIERLKYKQKYIRQYWEKNSEYLKEKAVQYRKKIKLEVFTHYGIVCACCGERNIDFLTIDHKNNDGSKHRRTVWGNEKRNKGCGIAIYNWIKKHNYPNDFQLLCYNCNIGRSHNNGICPHKK